MNATANLIAAHHGAPAPAKAWRSWRLLVLLLVFVAAWSAALVLYVAANQPVSLIDVLAVVMTIVATASSTVIVWLLLGRVRRLTQSQVNTSNDMRAQMALMTRLGLAIEQATEAVVVADADGLIEYVNPGFERMAGYEPAQVIGHPWQSLVHEADGDHADGSRVLAWGKPWAADMEGIRADGSSYRASAVISPIVEEGHTTGYVAVARDVTDERRHEEDALQYGRERALIADTIRAIDGRGSPAEIAQAVCEQLARLTDVELAALFVFSVGDEAVPYGFAQAQDSTAASLALPAGRAEYLRQQSMKGPWIEAWHQLPGHPYNDLFRSLGVKATAFAPLRDGDQVVGCLLINSSRADAEQSLVATLPALVEFADITATVIGPKLAEHAGAKAAAVRVARVIEERQFRPVFQPIVDVEIGRVVGYEGLTRFNDGVAPEERLREAEAVGLGGQLELAMMASIIEAAGALPVNAWLNINLSPDVIQGCAEVLGLIQSCPRPITIEVTEHAAIDDYAAFRDAVHRLGPRVRLAIDDAGAGFASMRHVVELRPAMVKLDRAVVANIDHDEARRALAAGMRHFARTAGFWLIAEGVETDAERRALLDLDIHYMQGFLLGRPVPAEDL